MKIDHYIPAYNQSVDFNVLSQSHRDHSYCAEAGHTYRIRGAHSCDLIQMRNNALHRALTEGFDFLFMQDADVFSPAPNGPLQPLLATALETEATISGALVSMRTRPPRANVWPVHVGETYEADKIGTGMVLLDLRKIRGWYDDYDGPCFARVYEDDKCITPKIGSDIYFSYVVRQHGGRIVCNAAVPTVHVDATYPLEFDGAEIPNAAVSAEGTGAFLPGNEQHP